ncbi:MAG: hypothetical protein J6R12_03230 [Bacteroidales bacterium]|nr:hypothetical protein [Bacteroidales bacterium]
MSKKQNRQRALKKNSRRTLLWLAICGVILSVIGGALLCLCNDNGDKEDDTQKTTVAINTKEDAEKYLCENSNYSAGTLKELDFNSYWPKEYFTISIKDKKISYWKDGASVAEVEYLHGTSNTLKKIKSKDTFASLPKNLKELETLVEENYCKEIKKAFKERMIDEDTKNFSILYNALAGHPGSYIVLGRANEDGDWKRYQPTDFPTYTMPSEKDLIALARKHAATPDSMANATLLGVSFLAYVDSISVKAVSFDNRGDKIWYGNENRAVAKEKERKDLKLPYDYTTLNGIAACGWVVPDGKEELENAKEYYSNIHFMDENTYNALKSLKWNAPKVEPPTPEWLLVLKKIVYYAGIVFICLGAILLFVAVLPFVVKFFKDRSNKQSIVEEDADDEDDDVDDNEPEKEKKIPFEIVIGGECDEELQEENLRLKKEIEKLNKELKSKEEKTNNGLSSAIEEYKNSKEYKNAIEAAEKAAVDKYKGSKEYKNVIEAAEKAAVDKYKKSDDFKKVIANAEAEGERKFKDSKAYKNLEVGAKNWKSLSSYTSEDKVITFLNNTHKVIPTFPLLNTLNNIYAEAKAEGKNERELVAVILAALDKQTGKPTGLQAFYKDLVANADYAVEVRDRFESIKDISQKFGERKGYMQIVSHGTNLSLWERLAVMLWAMECTNEVLKVFGKEHFSAGIIAHAGETHKDDIMQIFATRIFNKYISDQTAPAGVLTGSRENMMAEKLAEMQSKYGVSMSASQTYRDFVKNLDSTHDKLKANVVFINMMKAQLVDEFISNERKITEKGVYMSYVVAMGLHMCDYIRYMSSNNIDYCPNMRFVLSGLNPKTLDSNTEFRYKDPAYSGEYSNRIYEWMKESGIGRLKALVGNKYIMP